jgi:hypothetical protein
MAFRIHDENPVYLDADGVPCAGGSLTFTRTGTTTAHNVFSAPDLLTSLGNVITLDSAGRTSNAGVPVDVWLDASVYAYRVVLKNEAGSTIWTKDDVREVDITAVQVPDPADADDGQVLASDGTDLEYIDIRQVPDPTGHSGEQLGTDGELVFWEPKAEAVTYDEDNLPGGFEVDEGTSGSFCIGPVRVCWGNGTCPTAAALTSTVAVTFPTAFSDVPYAITVTAKSTAVTSNSPSGSPSMQATSHAAAGFTANAFVGEENQGGTDVINSAIGFTYIAIGPK